MVVRYLFSWAVIFAVDSVRADIVNLTNGNQMEGIVVKSSKDGIELRVSETGTVILDHSLVVGIKKMNSEQNAGLISKWRGIKEEARLEEERQRAYVRAQEEKGLVPHKGEWMTKEERHYLQMEEMAEETARRNKEDYENELRKHSIKVNGESQRYRADHHKDMVITVSPLKSTSDEDVPSAKMKSIYGVNPSSIISPAIPKKTGVPSKLCAVRNCKK